MTRRYLLALTMIALLASSAYTAFEMMIAQQESTGAVVNISGRQRMLSQRTAFFVNRMLQTQDEAEYGLFRQKLAQATNLMELAHKGLTEGSVALGLPSEMSDAVRRMYFEGNHALDRAMRRYIAALRQVQQAPFGSLDSGNEAVGYVLATAPGPLLDSLDLMVWQYQMEGEAAFLKLHRLETAVLTLTLLTLALEALLIFRPMVSQARDQIERITGLASQLRQARDGLEEQVRQRTRELEVAKVAAEQANLAKSRFLAAAGHDLLQPLDAIGMFTGMLAKKVPEGRGMALMRDLKNAQKSMRTLLRSLLDISKLEAGVMAAKPKPTPVKPILAQVGSEFWPQAEARGLSLRVRNSEAVILTDPDLLERILRNFLSNAVRYTPKGSILIGCRRRGGWLRIEVHDTGKGIPPEKRAVIFEEFSQLDDPDRDRSEGIGLGLAIVDRLSKLLGHRLNLWSKVGKGSTFSVMVPLVGQVEDGREDT